MGIAFLIYIASIVESIQGLLFIITLFFASIALYMIIDVGIESEESINFKDLSEMKTLRRFVILSMVFGLITALIPKERYIY